MKLKEFYQYKRELKKKIYLKPKILSLKSYPRLSPILVLNLQKNYFVKPRGILILKSSTNNTILTLTTLQGKVVFVRSCGCLGFQGKKKRTTKFAIESTLQAVTEKAKEHGWLKLILHLNGFAKGRLYALKTLKKSGISFVKLVEKTPIPHNGCRPKKIRRG